MKPTRLSFLLLALASLALLLALPAAAQAIPSSYQIKGVPEYTQLDSSGCGAACMAMVFDYWGPEDRLQGDRRCGRVRPGHAAAQ